MQIKQKLWNKKITINRFVNNFQDFRQNFFLVMLITLQTLVKSNKIKLQYFSSWY